MNDGWIALGIIIIFIFSAARPLLRKPRPDDRPPPAPKETLRDWRNEKK
jgi:hypothetical protein